LWIELTIGNYGLTFTSLTFQLNFVIIIIQAGAADNGQPIRYLSH